MPAPKLERTSACSGIYEIRCLTTGKIYIGSAVNIAARWEQHRRDLRRGSHVNPHLQSAWNLHSEANFQFVVLERREREFLLQAEQWWIEQTRCAEPCTGFNIKRDATCAGVGIARTITGFRDPSGNPIVIVGLLAFCSREGLDYRSMHRLAAGGSKLKSYKGWTHTNSQRRRDYIKTHNGFISPEGTRVGPTRNLAAFCRDHGLSDSHMSAVAAGRIISHRGWTHVQGRKPIPLKVHLGFVAPDGTVVRIANLAAFCRANGLCVVPMHELKSGKRQRHKGWTWKHYDGERPHNEKSGNEKYEPSRR